jgi:hypothetical protein
MRGPVPGGSNALDMKVEKRSLGQQSAEIVTAGY